MTCKRLRLDHFIRLYSFLGCPGQFIICDLEPFVVWSVNIVRDPDKGKDITRFSRGYQQDHKDHHCAKLSKEIQPCRTPGIMHANSKLLGIV